MLVAGLDVVDRPWPVRLTIVIPPSIASRVRHWSKFCDAAPLFTPVDSSTTFGPVTSGCRFNGNVMVE